MKIKSYGEITNFKVFGLKFKPYAKKSNTKTYFNFGAGVERYTILDKTKGLLRFWFKVSTEPKVFGLSLVGTCEFISAFQKEILDLLKNRKNDFVFDAILRFGYEYSKKSARQRGITQAFPNIEDVIKGYLGGLRQ